MSIRWSSDAHQQFADRLYAATADENFASTILPAFAEAMKAPSSNVGMLDRRTSTYTHDIFGIDPSLWKLGERYYFPLNPWVKAGFSEDVINPLLYHGPVIRSGSQMLRYSEYKETEYYQDFNRHTGFGDDMIAVILPVPNGVVAFAASTGGRLFDNHDHERARSIIADMNRAFKLHNSLMVRSAESTSADFITSSAAAVITVRDGTMAQANPAAQALLFGTAPSPVKHRFGRIVFADSKANEVLAAMARPDAPRTRSLIGQHLHERWLIQMVRRSSGRTLEMLKLAPPIVMVILTPLNAAAVARRPSLLNFLGLTATERATLEALVNGHSPERIAQDTSRSLHTVRWHIKSLISKTGATSFSDLVRIGALLLPL